MNIRILQTAINEIKNGIEHSIRTAKFNGKSYSNGHKAKEALIRSQKLILKVHEVTKASIHDVLKTQSLSHTIYPPIGRANPELAVTGFIKKKDQDVVVLFGTDRPTSELITTGPLVGEHDDIGREVTARAIVVGVRSQLSSVAKNFDTLMERAFAETLNLRLRVPELVMGEVYLLPIYEYDDTAMQKNRVRFETRRISLERFIRTFASISGRTKTDSSELYKYERTALILANFQENPPKICMDANELITDFGVAKETANLYTKLTPQSFAKDLIAAHQTRGHSH